MVEAKKGPRFEGHMMVGCVVSSIKFRFKVQITVKSR